MSYPIITGARRRWPKAPGVVALHAQPGRRNENTRQRRQPAYPGDALAWYANEFAALGMSNAMGGTDTLRHLFVLLIGLGIARKLGAILRGSRPVGVQRHRRSGGCSRAAGTSRLRVRTCRRCSRNTGASRTGSSVSSRKGSRRRRPTSKTTAAVRAPRTNSSRSIRSVRGDGGRGRAAHPPATLGPDQP